ncbi:MAG: type II secretion system protein [Patescibacteria group bacterium]
MSLSSQDSARRSDDVLMSRLRHQKNPKQLVTQAVSGFSLIEILIVISVLVILGTINFLSLRGMSDTARDSTRLSDIKNLTTSLGYYLTQNGVVPHPSGEVAITYSGATAWYQGTLGMSVVMPLGNPSKQPTDPLLRKEYTYSVTNDESQYQLSGIFE